MFKTFLKTILLGTTSDGASTDPLLFSMTSNGVSKLMLGWKLQDGFSIADIFLSCSKLMKFLCFPCDLSTKHEDLLVLYWWWGKNGDRSIVMDGLCLGTKYGLSMVIREVRRSRWLFIGMMDPESKGILQCNYKLSSTEKQVDPKNLHAFDFCDKKSPSRTKSQKQFYMWVK